ncbi:arginine N-succinyltransferase [Vibrio sp. SM6]|uniref:Arginine N-succinyltransferase n=1 Tax=Vibrio agarilyticus TaxID=2726741 RepID=A0A7X8TUB5_9VIBR|nr:arginine N-succinyltransferase [Vibrio agarilyticus]NLS14672.1 arginine N-succinyltransferase [Vibrio agarilyticus]
MLIVRPIAMADFDALRVCAVESGHGFTSLPVNDALLKQRIERSEYSFAKPNVIAPSDESYLMVAVDSETQQIAGTTGIEAAIGWDVPFYSYQISKLVHSSERLGVRNVVRVLTLGNNYTGCSEICTLFLRPAYRHGLNGRLLSKCRFLLMADHPQRFSETIFAEMRGVSTDAGDSPFWQWLQAHFFSIDFTLADYLTGIGKKGFIADLMPKLPIYINLLSPQAQAVIGQVHDDTKPALALLEQEGFSNRGYVDIFDAGPTMECDLRHIEAVRHSALAQVRIGPVSAGEPYLIANNVFDDGVPTQGALNRFRATIASAQWEPKQQQIRLTPDVAQALEVESGATVRLLRQPSPI